MRHHGFSCSSLYTVTPEQAQENLLIERGYPVLEVEALSESSGHLRDRVSQAGSPRPADADQPRRDLHGLRARRRRVQAFVVWSEITTELNPPRKNCI